MLDLTKHFPYLGNYIALLKFIKYNPKICEEGDRTAILPKFMNEYKNAFKGTTPHTIYQKFTKIYDNNVKTLEELFNLEPKTFSICFLRESATYYNPVRLDITLRRSKILIKDTDAVLEVIKNKDKKTLKEQFYMRDDAIRRVLKDENSPIYSPEGMLLYVPTVGILELLKDFEL